MGERKKGSKTADRTGRGGNVSERRQRPPYRVRSSRQADAESGLLPRLCLGSPPPTIPLTHWHEAPPSSFGADKVTQQARSHGQWGLGGLLGHLAWATSIRFMGSPVLTTWAALNLFIYNCFIFIGILFSVVPTVSLVFSSFPGSSRYFI